MSAEIKNWNIAIHESNKLASDCQFEKAEEVLKESLKSFPDEMWLYFHQANLATKKGDFQVALVRWNEVIQKFPSLPESYCELAKLCIRLGEFSEAESALTEQAKHSFEIPATFLARYELNSATGKNEKAEKSLRDGLEKFPDDLWINYHWCAFFGKHNPPSQAVETWAQFIEKFPEVNEAYSEYAGLLMRNHNCDLAISVLESLRSKGNMVASGFVKLAEAYSTKRDFEKSLSILREGLEAFPNEQWLKYHYCLALANNAEMKEAIENLVIFCAEFPALAEAKMNLIEYLIRENRGQEAKEICKLMAVRNSNSNLLNKALAKISEIDDEWIEAQYYWHLFDTNSNDSPEERKQFDAEYLSCTHKMDFKVFSYWASSDFESLPQPKYMRALLGDNYEVITDKNIQEILKKYPPFMSEMYNQISIAACKSDFARLLYLYEYGGLYLDMHCAIGNLQVFCGLHEMLSDKQAVFFKTINSDGGFSFINGIILAKPGANAVQKVINGAFDKLKKQFEAESKTKEYINYNIWEISGPKIIGDEIIEVGSTDIIASLANDTKIEYLFKIRSQEAFDLFHFYSYRKSNNHWTDLQQRQRLFKEELD